MQQLLIDAAAKYPSKTAVRMVLKYLPMGIAVQAKLRYRDLDRMSSQFAVALAKKGMVKGTKVAIMLPNMPAAGRHLFWRSEGRCDRRQHQPHLSGA